MWILHSWVDNTCRPSASAALSEHVVLCLFLTGIPSITKICVAPESAMAPFVFIQKVAPTNSVLDKMWLRAHARYDVALVETFNVTAVTMSLVLLMSNTVEHNSGGYNEWLKLI